MDELMELVGKIWPIKFTGAGNIRFAWRHDKLHSLACYGQLDRHRVTVDVLSWWQVRSASVEFMAPSSVYALDGEDVLFASWPVHSGLKYPLIADALGALVAIPKSEFKKVERKQS